MQDDLSKLFQRRETQDNLKMNKQSSKTQMIKSFNPDYTSTEEIDKLKK